MSIMNVPNDVLRLVNKHLLLVDQISLKLTNRRFFNIVNTPDNFLWSPDYFVECITYDCITLLDWANDLPVWKRLLNPYYAWFIRKFGSDKIYYWLRDKVYYKRGICYGNTGSYLYEWAAGQGFLRTMNWLKINKVPFKKSELAEFAIDRGLINTLKWLYSIDKLNIDKLYTYAAKHGKTESIQWLYDNNLLTDVMIVKIAEYATIEDKINILKWLYKKGIVDLNINLCEKAIQYDNVDVLKWLYKHGALTGISAKTAAEMVSGGNSKILRWLWSSKLDPEPDHETDFTM